MGASRSTALEKHMFYWFALLAVVGLAALRKKEPSEVMKRYVEMKRRQGEHMKAIEDQQRIDHAVEQALEADEQIKRAAQAAKETK